VISALNQRTISHAVQDSREHYVQELTLAANSTVEVELGYQSSITFDASEIYFGCNEQNNLDIGNKPLMKSYCNRFIERGEPEESPETHPETNYADHHKFYHLRKPRTIAKNEVYSIGCKVETRQVGRYEFKLFFIGEEVGGIKNRLFIRVEDRPTTRMRCVSPEHRWTGCFIQPL
jgi:hypothetical protein